MTAIPLPGLELTEPMIAAVRAPTRKGPKPKQERVRWMECGRCHDDAKSRHPWYCSPCWEAMIQHRA